MQALLISLSTGYRRALCEILHICYSEGHVDISIERENFWSAELKQIAENAEKNFISENRAKFCRTKYKVKRNKDKQGL